MRVAESCRWADKSWSPPACWGRWETPKASVATNSSFLPHSLKRPFIICRRSDQHYSRLKWVLHSCSAKSCKNNQTPTLLRECGIKSSDSRRSESVSLLENISSCQHWASTQTPPSSTQMPKRRTGTISMRRAGREEGSLRENARSNQPTSFTQNSKQLVSLLRTKRLLPDKQYHMTRFSLLSSTSLLSCAKSALKQSKKL